MLRPQWVVYLMEHPNLQMDDEFGCSPILGNLQFGWFEEEAIPQITRNSWLSLWHVFFHVGKK